jgi:hypothetical protein
MILLLMFLATNLGLFKLLKHLQVFQIPGSGPTRNGSQLAFYIQASHDPFLVRLLPGKFFIASLQYGLCGSRMHRRALSQTALARHTMVTTMVMWDFHQIPSSFDPHLLLGPLGNGPSTLALPSTPR